MFDREFELLLPHTDTIAFLEMPRFCPFLADFWIYNAMFDLSVVFAFGASFMTFGKLLNWILMCDSFCWWRMFKVFLGAIPSGPTAISIVNFEAQHSFSYTSTLRSINLSSIFVQYELTLFTSANKRRAGKKRNGNEKMIKWKKQCEFRNKNLRMKTKIEAITNKRSKNVKICTETKEERY